MGVWAAATPGGSGTLLQSTPGEFMVDDDDEVVMLGEMTSEWNMDEHG